MPKVPAKSVSSKLQEQLKNVAIDKPRDPLWQGPCGKGPNGGITFSMLSRWLSCRERARVQYIEGIKPVERFNHRTDYGTMWHLCEEALAKNIKGHDLFSDLGEYCLGLSRKFPLDQEQIGHWYNVCKTQFPIYVEHWSKHPDVKKRTPLMQEQVFDVPYDLPSGRTIRLRGKFDSVDLIDGGVWLQENKTKGDVDVQAIQRQLTWDLQTMMYLIALQQMSSKHGNHTKLKPIYDRDVFVGFKGNLKGVRYNVVRRPLSGGKGNITRSEGTKGAKCAKCNGENKYTVKKTGTVVDPCDKCKGGRVGAKSAEPWDKFYERLGVAIRDNADHFFQRWNTEIMPSDIKRFRDQCLDPILENVCNWYAQIEGSYTPDIPLNWRHPFGAVNTIDEYGSSDVDEYLNHKSMTGLRRVDKLFEELT